MLRPDTDLLWRFLSVQPALGGFVLVGGSALTLHLGHRVSEDLDFVWPGHRLPVERLTALQRLAAEHDFEFQRRDDPAAADEFEIAGMSLHDYQQDFLVKGSVKVSFFAADEPLSRILNSSSENTVPRIASLPELFASKCLVAASRSKTRDWFDLYVLMKCRGFTMDDFHAAFVRAGVPQQFDLALRRLCSGRPSRADEGYELLISDAPSLDDLRHFFTLQRDHYEQSQASLAAKSSA
jgi:predicted nucleotidyltransferase component of viral defense system